MRAKVLAVGLAAVLALHAVATEALASTAPGVPEISPGSISAGLALLAGSVLVLRSRRRSK
jgi:LPXTG-motif cell wall-anchored protein